MSIDKVDMSRFERLLERAEALCVNADGKRVVRELAAECIYLRETRRSLRDAHAYDTRRLSLRVRELYAENLDLVRGRRESMGTLNRIAVAAKDLLSCSHCDFFITKDNPECPENDRCQLCELRAVVSEVTA